MNSKKDFCKVILVLSISLFFISCGVPMTKGEKWLYSKKENPEINISGTWVSPEWGVATFKQENKDVTGSLGDYPVKGIVSGNTIYLLMYSGKRVHYSAELKASDNNTFKGVYSKYAIVAEVINNPNYLTRPMSLAPMK
jgi:hypothetical protein